MSPSTSAEALPPTVPYKILTVRFDNGSRCNHQPLYSKSEDQNTSLMKYPKVRPPSEKGEDDDIWMVATSCSSTSSASNTTIDDEDENDCESDVESGTKDFETFTFRTNEIVNLLDIDTFEPRINTRTANNTKCGVRIELSRIKEWLAFYSNFVYKTGNQDILLKLMQWSLWLVGAFIPMLLPGQEFSYVAQWITKISYDICYARYVTRLLGLPIAIEGALSGSWASCSSTNDAKYDSIYRVIGHILAYSMIAYYPVEHVAFFLWMNPNAETVLYRPAGVWFYISMRCWLVYLLAESFQCILKCFELGRYKAAVLRSKKNDLERSQQCPKTNFHCDGDDSRSEVTPKELDDEIYNVMLLLVRNSFYLLPCIHWSMSSWDTNPWLPDVMVNGLMWSEAVLSLYQAIYNS
jgi:hypothetical protein